MQAIDVSSAAGANSQALLALPAKPGVLIIEDETGSTLALLQTADLRRAARGRLGPLDPEHARSRQADLRPIARRVLACTVGSAFESDWATLQLARLRLPHAYKSMLDRWQSWFLHIDADAKFPQWIKTAHPTEARGVHIGPMADKHAAARLREMLEDAFDLCRYHHILVQAPQGSACAYKEMGRCPAPCDGTVSMDHYRKQVGDSITFARSHAEARLNLERQMHEHAAAMNFEQASRCKSLLERTAICTRSEFTHVRDLQAFRYLAVLPGERQGSARIFAIVGGWISPIADVASDADTRLIDQVITAAHAVAPSQVNRHDEDIENIGMVCRHLLLPKVKAKRRRAAFIHWPNPNAPGATDLQMAIHSILAKDDSAASDAAEDHQHISSDSAFEYGT